MRGKYYLEHIATLEDLLTVKADEGLQLLLHGVEEIIDEHEIVRLTNEKKVSKELTNQRRVLPGPR